MARLGFGKGSVKGVFLAANNPFSPVSQVVDRPF
jgi:hypothetical protein